MFNMCVPSLHLCQAIGRMLLLFVCTKRSVTGTNAKTTKLCDPGKVFEIILIKKGWRLDRLKYKKCIVLLCHTVGVGLGMRIHTRYIYLFIYQDIDRRINVRKVCLLIERKV